MKPVTKIRIYKSEHHFAAAHFLVDMGKCERLHGHNYAVTVELAGSPGEDNTIIDFHKINPVTAKICAALDHRILLAQKDERHEVTINNGQVEVRFAGKMYSFPANECVFLPLPATTVERLAAYIADQLVDELVASLDHVDWIEVGVGEGSGQMALYRRAVR